MNIYIANREWLIDTINAAFMRGAISLERDILIPHLDTYKVMAYEHKGYVARITGLKSYFDENMKLLDDKNLEELFTGNPIYTKIRDDNPTRYIGNAKASNVMVADGCVIEGEVENSILFRGVKIAKGAKVKNCVLMQDTIVGEGTKLEYIISDKNVKITDGKELKGDEASCYLFERTGCLVNGCMLCPRQCQIKREEGKRGFCGESDLVRLSRARASYVGRTVYLRDKWIRSCFFLWLYASMCILPELSHCQQ